MLSDNRPPICGRTRTAVRITAVVGVLGLVLCVVTATLGFGSMAAEAWFSTYVYPLLFLPPAALLFLKARADSCERRAWTLIGVAYVLWAAASMYYNVSIASGSTPGIPSPADVGWLAFYPLLFVGFVRLVKSRTVALGRGAYLDGLIGALALAAVGSAFLVGPIVSAVAGAPLQVVTLLAYPLGAVALVLVVLSIGTQLGWSPGRDWLVIGAALMLQVGADCIYSYKSATGTWQFGTLVDAFWPAAALLIASAAWQKPAVRRQASGERWHGLVVASVFTTVAVAVLMLTSFHLQPVACVLAAVTIMASLVRAAAGFQQKLVLGDLALRDPLTGLLNHRQFHEAVDDAADRAARDNVNFSVVILDVDGFKAVNDDYGHAEGDRLLRDLAALLSDSVRAEDLVCRVGGDEFAILLPGGDASIAQTVARRTQAKTDALQAGIGISYGIGDWATDGPVTETMLLRADIALYAAKAKRRLSPGSKGRSRSTIDGPRGDDDMVTCILAAAREHLGVDVVYLSEFAGGQQIFRTLDGDTESFGLQQDGGIPLAQTYCQPMVDGRVPNLITDASADHRVSHLAATHDADIGTYLGVPLQLPDGSLYGTLCCLSHTVDVSLGERDVAYMRLLARLIADHLDDRARGTETARARSGEAAISALLSALAAHDSYTGSHSLDVVELARKVAHQLRLPREQVADIEQVALLHDLGKIGIPDAILQKPDKLTATEWQIMHQHPAIGAQIIESISSLSHLAPAIRAEHERYDGHGYPNRIAGDTIPTASRIVFACDAYHAMVSNRPYRQAMSDTDAQTELQTNAGSQFDPNVIAALLRVLQRLDRSSQAQTTHARD